MHKDVLSARLKCLVSAFVLWTATFSASSNSEESWYQVEVLVFERQVSGGSEVWPRNIRLSYPANFQYLFSSQESDDQAYVFLPDAERKLNDTRRGISRRGSHRVLFHQAWRQPIYGRAQAPGLIVSGGERHMERNELEGSITFSRSRYLHIDVNLWLAKLAANDGRESEYWPPLPNQPSELDREREVADSLAQEDNSPWRASIKRAPLNDGREEGAVVVSDEPYLVEHLVQLKQSRKMRGGELHYIDHPRLGVLVRVNRLGS